MPPLVPSHVADVERLRLHVAQLQWQVAQLQAPQRGTPREALGRATLRAYVPAEKVEQYVIDLDAGLIRPREGG